MGYKQKSGPLQRAGYDKGATTPFRLEEPPEKENKKLPTISSSEFTKLQLMGARGERGGLLDAKYLTKAGVPGYQDKKGYWTINEEEAKQVRAYKQSQRTQ